MTFNPAMLRLIIARTERARAQGWKARLIKIGPARCRVEFFHPHSNQSVSVRGGQPEVVFAQALGQLPANPQPQEAA